MSSRVEILTVIGGAGIWTSGGRLVGTDRFGAVKGGVNRWETDSLATQYPKPCPFATTL
jgi:hypothetical protein